MFASFKYESISLKDIALDDRNPRIVSQKPLATQGEIIAYLYENEDLEAFTKKIAHEGRNAGAERPYVVKKGAGYIVVEGNTRIAAYKLLTGLIKPPKDYEGTVPHISEATKKQLLNVDCSVAPDRDALMPIMASAHFGAGDKSKWGYLGSRKAVYDEWKGGKTLAKLAKLFNVTQSEIRDFILEYQLYLKAVGLQWTHTERDILLKPNLAFNPPVRFLQTSGHKELMEISYDTANLKVVFGSKEAEKKFKHLLKKLVIAPVKGLGATATYDAVFADYGTAAAGGKSGAKKTSAGGAPGGAATAGTSGGGKGAGGSKSGAASQPPAKPGALFSYPVKKINNALVTQLLKEARELNCKKYPAAATFLLRNIVETVLKHIIDDQAANAAGNKLDLEGSLNLCISKHVQLSHADKNILSEFKKDHVAYLNLGAHGNVIPNDSRLAAARDAIDQFIKKNV